MLKTGTSVVTAQFAPLLNYASLCHRTAWMRVCMCGCACAHACVWVSMRLYASVRVRVGVSVVVVVVVDFYHCLYDSVMKFLLYIFSWLG